MEISLSSLAIGILVVLILVQYLLYRINREEEKLLEKLLEEMRKEWRDEIEEKEALKWEGLNNNYYGPYRKGD